jgi:hypothetical protein
MSDCPCCVNMLSLLTERPKNNIFYGLYAPAQSDDMNNNNNNHYHHTLDYQTCSDSIFNLNQI